MTLSRFSVTMITAFFLVGEGILVLLALAITKIWTVPTPWLRWLSFALLISYAAAVAIATRHKLRRST